MEEEVTNVEQQALLIALGVFFVCFAGVVGLALMYDFGDLSLGGLLFLMSTLCCILIAKNTYDVTVSVTQEKVPQQSIFEASKSMYSQLYKKSPVPYFVIDLQGVVTSANTAAARLLGLQQNKLIGVNVFALLNTNSADHKDLIVEKFISGIGVSDELVHIMRPDHREAWALLSLFQFTTDLGGKQGLLTLVDITKQKKAEDAKSEFVSLASHQLRTPIAGMKWSAELLEMDSPETLTDRQHKYMDRLMESIGRMSMLVDDFLRVSRFELGNFQADYEPLSLQQLFADVMQELAQTVTDKQLHMLSDFDPSVRMIMSDPNLLRMIVTNLCSNAVKYTPPGGTVTLGYKREGEVLVVTVIDTGMGIPANDQEQIFSKLFRASNATRDVPDGTGLGLYIVREAVAVLRGKATFSSVEGKGTTFTVRLPFEPADGVVAD